MPLCSNLFRMHSSPLSFPKSFLSAFSRLLSLLLFLAVSAPAISQPWTSLVTDVSGDGQAAMPDGKELFYSYDPVSDTLSFKVEVFSIAAYTGDFGVNIQVNIPGVTPTTNWGAWGPVQNTTFAYNRLITVWVTGTAPSTYAGTIGVADIAGVGAANFTNLAVNNIAVEVSAANNEIILRMPRQSLITNGMLTAGAVTVNVSASVGLSTSWSDDIFTGTGSMNINTVIPLTAPVLITPTNGQTSTTITPTLSWGPVTGANDYLYQLTDDPNFVLNVQTGNTFNTSQSMGPLSGSTTFYWRIRASDGMQTSPWSATWSFTTAPGPLIFPQPTLWLPPDNSFDQEAPQITLNWDDVSGANKYDVKYSENANMSSATNHVASNSIYTISGLTFQNTYYWQVRAKNDTLVGPWSAIWNFSTRKQDLSDGIEELNEASPVQVFPNPVLDEFFVEWQSVIPTEYQITILDPIGRVIQQSSTREQMLKLNLGEQQPGLYTVLISDGEKTYLKKLLKL